MLIKFVPIEQEKRVPFVCACNESKSKEVEVSVFPPKLRIAMNIILFPFLIGDFIKKFFSFEFPYP